MASSSTPEATLERMVAGRNTEVEVEELRQWLNLNQQQLLQMDKYSVHIEQGQNIHIGDSTYVSWNDDAIQALIEVVRQQLPQPSGIPDNLPRSGVMQFVGRDQVLIALHQQLQQTDRTPISAIVGMGGVGKTELALQYALNYRLAYPGGVCWLQARGGDLGTQIVQFGRSRLQLNPSEDLDLQAQVGFCWTHWKAGKALIILDDVTNYQAIKPWLPPNDSRFQVLITTRLRLGKSVQQFMIDVLDESAAVNLLASLVGLERLEQECSEAQHLCAWLGYLPLGIELVGRYLDRKPDLSIQAMQRRLEKKRLEEKALQKSDDDMTGHVGVAAAFELSWEMLNQEAKELGLLLSLFALAPIPWSLVEHCLPEFDPDDLEELRDDFWTNLHLLQRKGNETYQLHQLTREFLMLKQTAGVDINSLRQQFCSAIAQSTTRISDTLTLDDVTAIAPTIPHIAEVATALTDHLSDQDLIKPFMGLAQFYQAQGFYVEAADWYEQCRDRAEQRLGTRHIDVAISLDRLADCYQSQSRYSEAETLYQRALGMKQDLLGTEHIEVAHTFHHLATLYSDQGRLEEAEVLFGRSLTLRHQLLGEEHPDIAEGYNNLALVYKSQVIAQLNENRD